MFRWAAPQPLPSRLQELLDRADATFCPWVERTTDVVAVFLPPHLLVEDGSSSHASLKASYTILRESCDNASSRPFLINGDRLLTYSADELRTWSPDRPLPRAASLHPVPAFEGALTKALIEADPSLFEQYQWLDFHSLRGGSDPDVEYQARLTCNDPQSLLFTWNQIKGQRSLNMHLEATRDQLTALEDEFEQYVLDSRETASKLSWNRHWRLQALQQLQRQHTLLQRLFTLQARLASCGLL